MALSAGRASRVHRLIRFPQIGACSPNVRSRTISNTMNSTARGLIRRALACTFATATSLLALARPSASATVERASITVGESERHYLLVRPDHAPDGPRPLVLILHGH